jgi:hypothetical protein
MEAVLDAAIEEAADATADAGRLPVMQFLLENGSSLAERDSSQKSALRLAAMSRYLPGFHWLLGNGLSITDIDTSGRTALLLAVYSSEVQAIHLLLDECGASTAETDERGCTVWSIAFAVLESCLELAEPETLSVILALCKHAAPPIYLDQHLMSENEHIAPDAAKQYDLARRAWRDSRLDVWQASWFNALVLNLLPPVLLGLVSEYRGIPLLSDVLLGGLGGDPMFYVEEDDDDRDEGSEGDEGDGEGDEFDSEDEV